MFIQRTPSRFSIFLSLITFCIFFSLGLTDLFAESSCVSCHTKENLLKKNLAPKEDKKSSLTSGAG
jgi:hypothetical protein